MGHVRVPLFYQVKSNLSVWRLEWQLTAHQSVVNNSGWPDVNLFLVPFFNQHFWSYVSRSAATFHHNLIWSNNLWKTKVSNLNLSYLFGLWILFNQNVLRFEVSVNHSTSLQVLNCFHQLKHNKTDFSFLKFIILYVFKQLAAFYSIHNNEHVLISLVGLPHGDYVWMRYQLNNLNLLS